MNGHARRCEEAIKELGFRFNQQITEKHNNGKSYYTHPNQPHEPLSVYGKMNEQVSRVVVDRARQIAGLSTTGAKRNSQAVKERRRIANLTKKQREEQERLEAQRRADEAGARKEWIAQAVRHERDRQKIANLMQPGYGR